MTTAAPPHAATSHADAGHAPAGRTPRAGRAQLLAGAVVAGALCVGAAVGVTADRVFVGRQRAAPASWLDAFATELALTPAQRAAVDTVLDERERVIDSLIAPVRPGIDAARAAARRQIRARLTPAQQARFDGYVTRMAREHR